MITSEPDFQEGTLNAYVVRPIEVSGGQRYGYKIVAVIDENFNFWSAYSGPTGWSDSKIAAEGDKISKNIAEEIFPSLASTGRIYSG